MSPEAKMLRAKNNLEQLSQADQSTVRSIINTSIQDARSYLMLMDPDNPKTRRILEVAYDYETTHQQRSSLIKLISSALKKAKPITTIEAEIAGYEKAASREYGIPDPQSLLPGHPTTPLSPLQAGALAAVETAWNDAARLAGLVKNYARAGTAAKALCGLRLRALREHYFGPRTVGRPKKSESGITWDNLLADRLGITRRAADNWMHMADAVESIAEREGLDLRTTCEKLPWDWTPEESAMIDATVHALCEDKTQRQLLQADFLADLGYEAPEKPNSSNNPLGKNGGKKKPASSPAALLKERQAAARLLIYGVEEPGSVAFGSPARFMIDMVNGNGAELEALPKVELQAFYDHEVKPFADLIRNLIKSSDR